MKHTRFYFERSDIALAIGVFSLFFLFAACSASDSKTPPLAADPAGKTVEQNKPSVQIKTDVLQKGMMDKIITAYGRVVPLSGHTRSSAVPYESLVQTITVTEGQQVSNHEALIEVGPSPATQLEFEQAQLEYETAKKNATLVTERMDLKLATRQETLDAQQRLMLSKQRVENWRKKGLGAPTVLKSDSAGVVWNIQVQPGEIVPAGQMMLAMVPEGKAGVILGIEPENIDQFGLGTTAHITRVNGSPEHSPIAGKVSFIAQQLNPDTRLIDVLVQPDQIQNGLLLNEYVSGQIVISSKETLIAPKAAVLPDDQGFHLFTFSNQHAVRHSVQIGLKDRLFP